MRTVVLLVCTAIFASAQQRVVVKFKRAVEAADARRQLAEAGARVIENPDLVGSDWLVEASGEALQRVQATGAVIKVFEASEELASAVPVLGCAFDPEEALAPAEFRSGIGLGWDGPGNGPASLTWSAERIHPSLDSSVLRRAVERALSEWSRHAKLGFEYTPQTDGARNLDFVFASREHGDGHPFDGKGRTLAHAFYPADVMPEPLAGDVHFDADEWWSDGGFPDLYSVALHEIGHALGLTHSDVPGAVMYPYYRVFTQLQPDDIAALRTLYAADEALTLTVSAPAQVSAAAVDLRGTTAGASGEVTLAWTTPAGQGTVPGGASWTIAAVPLSAGLNRITVTAHDSGGQSASRVVTVQRSEIAPPAPAPPQPSSGPPSVVDNSVPVLSVTSPAAASYTTSAASIRVAGTARDNRGIREVTWQCGPASGTAAGTTSWSFTLPLLKGENNLIIRARDEAGNVAWRSRSITRR